MNNILTKFNATKPIFIFNVVVILLIPLLLLGLTFLQLSLVIIFFIYILWIFISIKKETLKKIRYAFLIGLGVLVVFIIIGINLLKSPNLDSFGGLAILIGIAPIFVVGLIGLILSFTINLLYDYWERWKFKHILTILIALIFIISFLFTYQYALINFSLGNYDGKLCERQNKLVIEDCYKNLAAKSKNPIFCKYFSEESYDYGECVEGSK